MANDKNNPSFFGGPPTKDALDYDDRSSLDNVVIGGCSTCGSLQHDTVKCDRKDSSSEFMMSGALQPDTNSSTSPPAETSSTAAPAAKSDQANTGSTSGQVDGRRRSV